MLFLESRGVRLFFEQYGTGDPALLFVHGVYCSHDYWKFQVGHFARLRRVVTYDLRGHGASAGPADYTVANFASDTIALVNALSLPRVVLIGHSLGSRVVLQAYRDAPERIAGLVLMDGSRVYASAPGKEERKPGRTKHDQKSIQPLRQRFEDLFGDNSDPEFKERIIGDVLQSADRFGGFSGTVPGDMATWDSLCLEDALDHVAVPLMVIQSTYVAPDKTRTGMLPGGTSPYIDFLRKHVPGIQVKIVSGVGHFNMLEAPKAVNEAITEFLERL